jgi:hypothetical protein
MYPEGALIRVQLQFEFS